MPDRPPNCRTAEIACTISEMHALSPKLAGKKCIYVLITYSSVFVCVHSMCKATVYGRSTLVAQ